MRNLAIGTLIGICFALVANSPGRAGQSSTPSSAERACAPGSVHLRTTLYFGLTRPTGRVSERQWQNFLAEEVTPRFPDGLTVWQADGQWRQTDGRISRERAKVLLLVHEETPAVRSALAAIVVNYKRSFQQESVLWETSPVCAAF